MSLAVSSYASTLSAIFLSFAMPTKRCMRLPTSPIVACIAAVSPSNAALTCAAPVGDGTVTATSAASAAEPPDATHARSIHAWWSASAAVGRFSGSCCSSDVMNALASSETFVHSGCGNENEPAWMRLKMSRSLSP